MMDFRAFEEFCESRGVHLTPHQRNFAASVLASDQQRMFLVGGLGTGRTYVNTLLEQFGDEQRRANAGALQ